MRRSFHKGMATKATKFPTYEQYPKPIEYMLPFTDADWIGFRKRWSQPGIMVTQSDLAKWLGMNPRQIRRYENDSAETAQHLVMALRYLDAKLVESCQRQVEPRVVPDFDFGAGEEPRTDSTEG